MNIFKHTFSKFDNVWVETTEESHKHGGSGWEFGTCLWSPSAGSTGRKIYELMFEPKVGDAVIHFYKQNNIRYLNGSSIVKKTCEITNEPPEPGRWGGRGKYYRIDLQNYQKFEKSLELNIITKVYENEIKEEIQDNAPSHYPFNYIKGSDKVKEMIKLGEGKYLTKCTNNLFDIIREALNIEIAYKDADEEKRKEVQEEYAEGKRKRRETYFFSRNPNLVKRAKQLSNFKCEACKFDFYKVYGELGKNYIECHHENPLSERSDKEWNENLKTSINDVKCLCSNCHRMIHRKRPALKFNQLIEKLEKGGD